MHSLEPQPGYAIYLASASDKEAAHNPWPSPTPPAPQPLRECPREALFLFTPSCFSCCCSVAQSCLTHCNPMDCSTPGLPVLHHLLEFAQVHAHRSSNTLATWCKELTHWKRPWCWERLKAGGEGSDREYDGWMASPTQWTWVWASYGVVESRVSKHTSEHTQDRGVQFIMPVGPRGIGSQQGPRWLRRAWFYTPIMWLVTCTPFYNMKLHGELTITWRIN